MRLVSEIPRRFRHVAGSLIGAGMAIYFSYHWISGDRGLMTWLSLNRQITEAHFTLQEVHRRREILEQRVNLLRPENLDRDLLEEQARRVLNMGRKGDYVIMDDKK